jgi:Glycosyl hydrolase family 9
VKGWHDAGDFSLYSASTNSALFWLLSAIADFSPRDDDTGIPESGNGVPDLLDEARWGLEWLLSVQQPGGGFRNTTCQERYGPYGTNRPERMSPYRAGEVGTIATGRAVGTLAFASVLYSPHDVTFAKRLLKAAQAGYPFASAQARTAMAPRVRPCARTATRVWVETYACTQRRACYWPPTIAACAWTSRRTISRSRTTQLPAKQYLRSAPLPPRFGRRPGA